MKLATFLRAGAQSPEIGLVSDAGVIPAPADISALGMIGLIEQWDALSGVAAGWLDGADAIPLDQVRLLAPVPRPNKILCMGLIYADHVAETSGKTPEHQIWFCKQPTAAHGPFDPIDVPKASTMVDYEVEMVAVIGKGGRHISKADAPAAIFGYCVGNDVSARDWQRKTAQWMLGKSFDTHGPFGPWITTSDAVSDPHALAIRSIVNGEVRQNSNTSNLIFDVYDQIVELSQVMTLEPGDIIYTGTPGGVGTAMKPPRYLQPGDHVACEVEGLGRIEAEMVAER
ncbi:fumarylacetoacetate hydrolase family protein [Phenylobacterium immobile]|uniref:fumarylacetoacetate hydrolase family protein n=1 Tax=Phenylobacterium immobile TaxID=21 RepID=UPI000B14B273|nr:fumarylacetoacetate hydrolase family protein [Phenylobacterium immobile]